MDLGRAAYLVIPNGRREDRRPGRIVFGVVEQAGRVGNEETGLIWGNREVCIDRRALVEGNMAADKVIWKEGTCVACYVESEEGEE